MTLASSRLTAHNILGMHAMHHPFLANEFVGCWSWREINMR